MTDLTELAHGPLFSFANALPESLPPNRIGVYTIWTAEGDFIYAGRGGLRVGAAAGKELSGLRGRLQTHRDGGRSGNRFCIYVCDRFVLPRLSREQIGAIGAGTLTLDPLTRDYIRTNLSFRFLLLATNDEAKDVEELLRRGLWFYGQKPYLNPL